MASITLVEFITRNSSTNATNTTAMAIWARRRSTSSSFLPHISTQKLVVIAVRAESALEKHAATMPSTKIIDSGVSTADHSPCTNMGSSWSGASGRVPPCFCTSIMISTPSDMNSRFTGAKAKP